MEKSFERFINFGSLSDKNNRQKLATLIYKKLQGKSESKFDSTNREIENYKKSIEQLIDNKNLQEICFNNPDLAEKITLDILDFTNKTKKEVIQLESQFDEETSWRESFDLSTKNQFQELWGLTYSFIKRSYSKEELDIYFYQTEFKKSLSTATITASNKSTFESVKEHFTENWNALFLKKKMQLELDYIEKQRMLFSKDFYKKIEELKNIQEILEPLTNELGRLWDMSKGNWQMSDFTILSNYATLLKKDKSVMELAEMLGRMQQAEKEYEEEMFATIQIKPEWKVNHASKSDLIGIHESDDLSSLLPSETVFLSDATLQTLFLKKYTEKKLQTFEFESKTISKKKEEAVEKQLKEKKTKKGPFIICVDTSGSMNGTPETVAKTICFALLKMALKENRKCYLISFSTQIETLNLTDIKNSLPKLIDFLSKSFNGGTDATPAINESLRMLETEEYKKADVLMISDFIMPTFNGNAKNKINNAKENGTKFHNLVIGNFANSTLTNEFDNNWIYNPNASTVLSLVKNITTLNL